MCISMENLRVFFFVFFFCTDDSTSDLNCVYYLRTGGKVRIIFLNS